MRYEQLATFLHSRRGGLSVEQIAEQLTDKGTPTHPNAVRKWLRGETRPQADRWGNLLEVLGVVLEEDVQAAYRLRWPHVAEVLEGQTQAEGNAPPVEAA